MVLWMKHSEAAQFNQPKHLYALQFSLQKPTLPKPER